MSDKKPTKENLKPCPFCGGSAKEEDTECGRYTEIVCQDCGNKTNGWLSTSLAYTLWNNRVSDE